VLCVLLAMATIALYSPVIGHSFVVFDRDYPQRRIGIL